MSDTENDALGQQVQDRRVKPSGVLPKNTQTWVVIGLALLMMIVIVFSGRNAPKEKRAPVLPQGPSVDPNASRIQEYQRRVEEEAEKLRREQAELDRTQRVLGRAQAGPMGSAATTPYPAYLRADEPRYAMTAPAGEENSIEKDIEKREYQSRFASNIALSYRKENIPPPSSLVPPSAEGLAKALTAYAALASVGAPTGAAPKSPQSPASEPQMTGAERANAKEASVDRDAEIDRAEGKQYRLFEGTVFETVLTNRLDGSFSGPANCMVTTNVYSHNGLHLLIPQGSRVLGEVRKVEGFGQQRLALVFHRLLMPDGYSKSLDKFQGLNQIGETGLKDQINHHYLQVFGVSLAIGAIAGLSQANTRYGIDESAADAYRQGIATSLSQSSLRILDRYLNVLPTFTIREGNRVKIYLSGDVLLPAYDRHQMPNDL